MLFNGITGFYYYKEDEPPNIASKRKILLILRFIRNIGRTEYV